MYNVPKNSHIACKVVHESLIADNSVPRVFSCTVQMIVIQNERMFFENLRWRMKQNNGMNSMLIYNRNLLFSFVNLLNRPLITIAKTRMITC